MHRIISYRVVSSVAMQCVFMFYIFFNRSKADTCEAELGYRPLGCFDSKVKGTRGLNTLLFTDRDSSSPKFSGKTVQWNNWNNYRKDILCRCARAARNAKLPVFGVEFYGNGVVCRLPGLGCAKLD